MYQVQVFDSYFQDFVPATKDGKPLVFTTEAEAANVAASMAAQLPRIRYITPRRKRNTR